MRTVTGWGGFSIYMTVVFQSLQTETIKGRSPVFVLDFARNFILIWLSNPHPFVCFFFSFFPYSYFFFNIGGTFSPLFPAEPPLHLSSLIWPRVILLFSMQLPISRTFTVKFLSPCV